MQSRLDNVLNCIGKFTRTSIMISSPILYCTSANAQYADGYYPQPSELPTMSNEEIGRVSYELYQRAMDCIDGMGSGDLEGYMSEEWCSNYMEWERNMRNEIQYAVAKAEFSRDDSDCIGILRQNVRRQFELAVFDNGGQSNQFSSRQEADVNSMHIMSQVEPCVERIGNYE